MNDVPLENWFYTREGEKCGPVSFADLRIKAAEAGLNPRLDLAWTKGMAEWKPAGEIHGLFERSAVPAPQEAPPPVATPYQPPQAEPVAAATGAEGTWPGASRRSYLTAIIILPILVNVVAAWSTAMFKEQFGGQIVGVITMVAAVLPLLFGIYYGIQRFPNLGMSRWWFLGNFVPFLNIWLGYRCFACPAGYAWHKKLDGAGIFLAIIYWLLFALAVLVIAAVIAALLGAMGSPEIRQQIQDYINASAASKP